MAAKKKAASKPAKSEPKFYMTCDAKTSVSGTEKEILKSVSDAINNPDIKSFTIQIDK